MNCESFPPRARAGWERSGGREGEGRVRTAPPCFLAACLSVVVRLSLPEHVKRQRGTLDGLNRRQMKIFPPIPRESDVAYWEYLCKIFHLE